MKKTLLAACLCSLHFLAKSQPCQPALSCDDAPLICGFNLHGLQGETPFDFSVFTPAPFDCGTLENNTWLAFTPCETSVAFEIQVISCQGSPDGIGLQAAIYQTEDCQNIQPVGTCQGQIFPGTTGVVEAHGLTPGGIYYLMLDGFSGDFCQYQIFVLQGVDTSPPSPADCSQASPGYLAGDTLVACDTNGVKLGNYQIIPPSFSGGGGGCPLPEFDCVDIQWNMPPGAFIVSTNSDNSQVTIDFTHATSGIVSVEFVPNPRCSCFCADFCLPTVPGDYDLFVHVLTPAAPEEIILPLATLCQSGASVSFCGNQITAPGTYECLDGCVKFVQQVTQGSASVSVANDTSFLVAGGSVTLDASAPAGATVTWTGAGIDASNQHSLNPTVSATGTYQVVVTDVASGCTASASATVFSAICPNPSQPVPPGDNCADAPSFCADFFQGYCSNNAGATPDTPGNLEAVFSCNVQNNQWLSFTACHDTVRFSLLVGECSSGEGLQFAVLQSTDCQNFSVFADCFTLAEGTSGTLVAPNLTVGQTYFLMLDGAGGDGCSWQILSAEGVSNGVTVQEENTPGSITNLDGSTPPTAACLTSPVILTLTFTPPICNLLPVDDPNECPFAEQQICQNPQPPGTCQVDTVWHVEPPGAIFQNGDSTGAVVTIIFPDTLDVPQGGFLEFTISVSILPVALPNGSACYENCLSECLTVLADSDPCAVLPHNIRLCKPDFMPVNDIVCYSELPYYFEGNYYLCGNHTIVETDPCGCDDVTELNIQCTFDPPASASQPVFQCDASGDFYTVSYVFNPPFFTYIVNGTFLNGNSYTSPPIPSGQPYSLHVDVLGFCQNMPLQLNGSYVCPCTEGNINLGIINICPGDCYNFYGTNFCSPGSYVESITDPGGCEDDYSFTIQLIQQQPLTIGGITTDCNATNLSYWVTFIIAGGFPTYFVNGTPINGNIYVSAPIPTGQGFSFLVEDSGSGCSGVASTLVQGTYVCDPFTDAGTMSQALISTCESQTASATWNNDGLLDGDDALVFVLHDDPVSLNNVLAINASGDFTFQPGAMNFGQTYFISAVAGNAAPGGGVDFGDPNLSVAQGQPVVFYSSPTLDLAQPPTLTCADPTTTLQATPGGGSGDFSFDWTLAGGSFSASQNPVVGVGGNYVCVATDNVTGCTAGASVQVFEDKTPPDLVAGGCTLTCENAFCLETAVSNTPGVIFTWKLPDGSTANGSTVVAGMPGVCIVVATNPQNGCTTEAQSIVRQDVTSPDLSVSDCELTCDQPTCNLLAQSNTFGASFVWSLPGGGVASGSSVAASAAGTFSVVATDPQNGCTTEAQAEVTSDTSLTEVVLPDLIFPASPAVLDFCGTPMTIWADTQLVCVMGCERQVQNVVFQLATPLLVFDVQLKCDPTSTFYQVCFSISGGTPTYFVNGMPSGNTFISNPIANASPYFFEVTDSGFGNEQIMLDGWMVCDPYTFCGTMSTSALSACGGDVVVTAWNNNALLDANDVLVFVLHDSPGNWLSNVLGQNSTGVFSFDPGSMSYGQTYFVSAVAGNAAPGGGVDFNDPYLSVSQGQPVTFYPIPSLDLLPPDTLTCVQNSVMLSALTDLPGSTFAWTAPGFFSTEQNPMVAAAGSYACIVTDPSGNCFATADVAVLMDTLPPDVSVFDEEITCQTPVVQLLANSATPGVSLTWTLPDGSILTGTSISTNLPGSYFVQAAAPNGCISQASAEVTDASVPPEIFISGGDIVCDQPANLTATSNVPGVIFNWILPDGTTAAGANISAIVPGIYFATATEPAGCENEASAEVEETEPVIEPFFEVKMPTCFGWEDGFIRLDSVAGGAAPFSISPALPLENLGAGEYPLHLTDANGCEAEALILLQNPPPVPVSVGNDTTIFAGENVSLQFEANFIPANVEWHSSDGLSAENQEVWQVQPTSEGTFWVVVEDENGCTAADSLRIFLKASEQIFVPNAFSPNGDGENDKLLIFTSKDVAQVRSFRIFDRWGDQVFGLENFQPDDPTKGWDGTAKGKSLDPAVFVFLAEVELKNGEVKHLAGDVTLVR